MHRGFSTLLISLILLVSPVSFAAESIPDFAPECSMTFLHHGKITVAPLDGATPAPIRKYHHLKMSCTFTPVFHIISHSSNESTFGRAPPV